MYHREELSAADKELIFKAIETLKNSYAPYSEFKVACAVRTLSNRVVCGCNQENIAYPSGLCAERAALFAVGNLGEKPDSVCIVAQNNEGDFVDAYPCGACRQVIIEFEQKISKKNIRILVLRKDGDVLCVESAKDLLPFEFEM